MNPVVIVVTVQGNETVGVTREIEAPFPVQSLDPSNATV